MTTVRKSLEEASISKERLAQLAAQRDEDIDYSDIPATDKDFWKDAKLVEPPGKKAANRPPGRGRPGLAQESGQWISQPN